MAALRERLLLEEDVSEEVGETVPVTEEAVTEAGPVASPDEAPTADAAEPDAAEQKDPTDPGMDPDMVNALSGAVNSQIASVYADIDGLNGLIAMLRDERDIPSRDEVIGLLDSIVDDRSVHIGMLQAISGMLSGRGGLVDAGSGIAADEIAQSEPAEAESAEAEGE